MPRKAWGKCDSREDGMHVFACFTCGFGGINQDGECRCDDSDSLVGCDYCGMTERDAEENARQEDKERDEWHKARIESAARYAHENPEMVDDYSDADPGL